VGICGRINESNSNFNPYPQYQQLSSVDKQNDNGNDSEDDKPIITNSELKVVNAVLSTLKDLLEALSGMTQLLSRISAHRDISLIRKR